MQSSEYHGPEDGDYVDYFPVADESVADSLNEKYDGYAIEREFGGRYLMVTNGSPSWRAE